MMYRVTVKCFFDGRLYEVGETVEFSAVNLPSYFEPIEQETEGGPDVIPAEIPVEEKQEETAEEKPDEKPDEKPKGRGRRKKNG